MASQQSFTNELMDYFVEDNLSLFMAFRFRLTFIHPSLLEKLRKGYLENKDSTEDGLSRRQSAKMAQLMDLPFELLSTITTFLAISCDGARDLARAATICKEFKTLATQKDVLKVVNFQNMKLLDRCEPHHHIDGLLSRCVRAGNLTAECKLALAILKGGTPLWRIMKAHDLQISSIICARGLSMSLQRCICESRKSGSIADLPYYLFCSEDIPHIYASYARLRHWRLIASYLAQSETSDVNEVFWPLRTFFVFFLGYDRARECGMNLNFVSFCQGHAFL